MAKILDKIKAGFKKSKAEAKIFGSLTMVQVRDKIDLSWTKSIKETIQKIVFFILRFAIITIVMYVALYILGLLIGMKTELIRFYFLFLVLFITLNILSVTFGLMKSLYYAEDNKVLATYPVSSTKLFISKLLVYLVFEIKRSFDLLLPVTLGFMITAISKQVFGVGVIFWSLLPLLFVVICTVLLGALLSIPCLFLYKLITKNAIVEFILLAIVVAGAVVGLALLINKLPVNKGDIRLVDQLTILKAKMYSFIDNVATALPPYKLVYRAIVGETANYIFGIKTFLKFLILVGASLVLFVVDILLIKPFYFTMMTKTFEFEKKTVIGEKKNVVQKPKVAFVGKELKLVFRDVEISGSYLAVYILTPLLLFLIDRVFMAMDINYKGKMIGFAINIVLIMLPLLASSTVVATVYSREGRAAYIKKTKPVKPYFLLSSKLLFNLVLTLPPIIVCGLIFKQFSGLNTFCIVSLIVAVTLFQYGHIFCSASLDIMNPQNELYATEGTVINNVNELKSTIIAFIVSILVAFLSYFFFKQSFDKSLAFGGEIGHFYDNVFVRLLLLGIVYFVGMFVLYILKIRAFYIDRQEASRE